MDDGASSYRRFLDGDNEGLRELLDLYYHGLVLYLNTYLRNLSLAEDLAEDTFFELVAKKPAFGGKSTFKTWLYAIGRNIAAEHLKRESHKKEMLPEELVERIADDCNVEENYIKEQEKVALHKAMAKLKPLYRQVLWLLYFEDMSYEEVAQIMNKSLPAVDHLVRRAKLSLKSGMKKEGYDDENH